MDTLGHFQLSLVSSSQRSIYTYKYPYFGMSFIGGSCSIQQGAFCIVNESQDGSSNKHFFFCARSDKERDEWMQAIANAK